MLTRSVPHPNHGFRCALCPSETPIFSRSASVKCGSAETSMSLSTNAWAYRSRPIFASHSAIGCTAVITVDYWSEQAEPMLSYWVSHYAREVPPKIRDEIFEDAATLGGIGFSAHFGQRDGGWFPVTQFRGRFFAVRAGIFESFRHRYAGGGSSFGFPRARQAPGITTALEWHLLPA